MKSEEINYRVLSTRAIWWSSALTVLAGAGVTIWLLLSYGGGDEQNRNQLDAIKTAGTIVVGTGGAVALLLAARRQRTAEIALRQKERDQEDVARTHKLQEQVALSNQDDATQRRTTELYAKAVEQLGSPQAVVRLGGLYALELLATEHETYCQTIVNVLCAYLRMPFMPPLDRSFAMPANNTANDSTQHELQARLTAQGILVKHLRPTLDSGIPSAQYWKGVDLDLSDAILVDWDMRWCAAHEATFTRAQFFGEALFDGSILTGKTTFRDANFNADCRFDETTFSDIATFDHAKFHGDAHFSRVQFHKDVSFDDASFVKKAVFHRATFVADAWFCETDFAGQAAFESTTFSGFAVFNDAKFTEVAAFVQARFNLIAGFGDTLFGGHAKFSGAYFGDHAWFRMARFGRMVSFDLALFTADLWLAGAKFSDDAWFRTVTLGGEASFENAIFTKPASFASVRLARAQGNRTVWPPGSLPPN